MKLLKTSVIEVGDTGPAQSHYTLSFDVPSKMAGFRTVEIPMTDFELRELRDRILIVEPLGSTTHFDPAITNNYEPPGPLPTAVPPRESFFNAVRSIK